MATYSSLRFIIVLLALPVFSALAGTDSTTVAGPGQKSPALEKLLDARGAVWQLSADDFMIAQEENGFRWLTRTRESARSVHPQLTFLEQRVWEATAQFESERLKALTLSLYNRGDAGDLNEAEFDREWQAIDQRLSDWAGSKGVAFKGEERTTRVTILRKAWVKPPYRLDLTWSFTPKHREDNEAVAFRAEFVRLRISRAEPDRTTGGVAPVAEENRAPLLSIVDLRAHVKRNPAGNVWIAGVPMVDQGEKGYCAAAVAERVLRYYGKTVDEHEIAQLAGTNIHEGTREKAMLAALRRIGSNMEVNVEILQELGYPEFMKLVTDYNGMAKKAGKPVIQIDKTQAIELGEIFDSMNPEILKQARVKHAAAMSEFLAKVKRYTQNGVPLVWGVLLGKIEETPALMLQRSGGHMRLIIGYNERTSEILYTDTWGAGHELKRMSLENAWTITVGLYLLEPRNAHF